MLHQSRWRCNAIAKTCLVWPEILAIASAIARASASGKRLQRPPRQEFETAAMAGESPTRAAPIRYPPSSFGVVPALMHSSQYSLFHSWFAFR